MFSDVILRLCFQLSPGQSEACTALSHTVLCETMRSATLAFIHRESHTQSRFLMHTCRGYERGINISRSTHFHLTLTSLSAFHPLSLPLCLAL